MRFLPARLAAAALVLSGVGQAWAAQAEPLATAPSIRLERTELRPGERVVVTLEHWTSPAVTLSVCGNLVKRGAADCNMPASQGVGLERNRPETLTELVVTAPPTTCPCVVRAANAGQSEVAVVPIELIGVPSGPVVDPGTESALAVTVDVREAHRGLVAAARSALGGPTSYAMTVSVRNRSASPVAEPAIAGSAGRSRTEQVVALDLPSPGVISPGGTWRHESRATVPAPVVGRLVWSVVASGAGPPAYAETIVSHFPLPLFALAAVLAADLAVIGWRFVARRRRRDPSSGPPPRRPPGPRRARPYADAGSPRSVRSTDGRRSRSRSPIPRSLMIRRQPSTSSTR